MSSHLPNEWTFCPWFVSLFSEPSVCIKFRLQESPKGNWNISWQSIFIKCRKIHNTEINHLHGWPFYPDLDHFIFGAKYVKFRLIKFILINCEINLLSSYLIIGYLKTRFEPKYLELSVCIEICLHESSKGMIHENWCTSKYQKFFFLFGLFCQNRQKRTSQNIQSSFFVILEHNYHHYHNPPEWIHHWFVDIIIVITIIMINIISIIII